MTQSIAQVSSHAVCAAPSRPGIAAQMFHFFSVARSRRALAQLSTEQLCDIGLSETDAQREASRSFWDAPTTWTK
ncbi:DUF1127 domain-containing protein [Planktotalea sp.]|uniref:DUF1127 domain-containing protein n=1 Tax=Planktotalea sp. TaxID=2029877 RepID=UPI003D6B7578